MQAPGTDAGTFFITCRSLIVFLPCCQFLASLMAHTRYSLGYLQARCAVYCQLEFSSGLWTLGHSGWLIHHTYTSWYLYASSGRQQSKIGVVLSAQVVCDP